ncbi:TauD/TfdA family dioxygenase [Haliangium ochraceum]|uniref:Gamma-butyrobetaine dioxygenase n=1 Tax=Haliangium ochraceum (strain DSM 14365 / JCM 11303 / SMP-2) TaxID=502025 RepID=D0LMF7_HALO1|nr:TauD/TfdA family dioxygenase [Haliangium ochraceum]ACY16863.1 Gamma-butyrobetaine dioxygenase [Haliangium ochraceum DSM 14365]
MSTVPTDGARAGSPAHIETLTREPRGLRIAWGDGACHAYHWVWLRDHCPCPSCCHPDTRERICDPLSWSLAVVPAELRVIDAELAAEPALAGAAAAGEGAPAQTPAALLIRWDDGHESRFSAAWLRAQGYGPEPRPPRADPRMSWDGAELAARLPQSTHAAVMGADHALRDWLAGLWREGVALLRDCPRRDREVMAVAQRIGPIRETNFGAYFDVVSKHQPNNNAYTSLALPPHTDLPNWADPPGLQFLHCLDNQAEGGDSLFVDGLRVVEELRAADPAALALLCRLPLGFRFQDVDADIRYRAPAIALDEHGALTVLRYNQGVLDEMGAAFADMEALYRAHRALGERIRQPALCHGFRLGPGDLVVFDNHRVLHGRAAFDPSTGRRHLQGCYVELELLHSRLRVLERALGPAETGSRPAPVRC